MQETSTQGKKLIFKVDKFPPTKIMLVGSSLTRLGRNLPRLLDTWENKTSCTIHMSIKSIKGCYFKSRIKKSGLKDWKEKLNKVSSNKRMGVRVAHWTYCGEN